jgi:hypothetical protein
MMRPTRAVWALLLLCAAADAHHSRAAFQLDQSTVLKVKVTNVRWTNPHVFIDGELVNAQGKKEQWTFEGHSISGLVRQGWSKDTVKAGDEVQMVVNRHKDPNKHFGLIEYVVMADGAKHYSVAQTFQAAAKAPVQPSTDFSGNWRFQFPGTPEQVRQRILLGREPPKVDGPYTELAKAQVKVYDPNKDPSLTCGAISLPALLMTVYEYKWTRQDDRILIEKEQHDHADRVIHLKNTARPASYKPNPLGFSVGRFEADGTLVVETTGFSPVKWGTTSGVDSSDQKRIVERYKLINGGMGMSLSYTHEDPVYLTQPLTGQGTFTKMPNTQFTKQECDVGAAQQHLKYE